MSGKDIRKGWTPEDDAELRRLAALSDDSIDLSDIPEIRGEPLPQRGMMFRPVKKSVTIRLDADIIAHFKQAGGLYQRAINDVLRQYVDVTRLTGK